jgi:hypothetical protein
MASEDTADPNVFVISLTKEQLAGIRDRERVLAAASQALHVAQADMNGFLSGIVTGQGHAKAVPIGVDQDRMTLTIRVG